MYPLSKKFLKIVNVRGRKRKPNYKKYNPPLQNVYKFKKHVFYQTPLMHEYISGSIYWNIFERRVIAMRLSLIIFSVLLFSQKNLVFYFSYLKIQEVVGHHRHNDRFLAL